MSPKDAALGLFPGETLMVCSCAGFLGSLILFDLLTNQKAGPEEDERSPGVRAPRGTRGTDPKIHGRKSVSEKLDPCRLCSQGSRRTPSSGGAEEVKEILQKLELSEYCDVFEKERMDPQALVRGSPGLSLAFPLHFASQSFHPLRVFLGPSPSHM